MTPERPAVTDRQAETEGGRQVEAREGRRAAAAAERQAIVEKMTKEHEEGT